MHIQTKTKRYLSDVVSMHATEPALLRRSFRSLHSPSKSAMDVVPRCSNTFSRGKYSRENSVSNDFLRMSEALLQSHAGKPKFSGKFFMTFRGSPRVENAFSMISRFLKEFCERAISCEVVLSSLGKIQFSRKRYFRLPAPSLPMLMTGAAVFGALSTISVYQLFGERVFARDISESVPISSEVVFQKEASNPLPEKTSLSEKTENGVVLGASDVREPNAAEKSVSDDDRLVNEVVGDLQHMRQAKEKSELEKKIREMVKGYPIEEMVPYILEKDKIVAAFLIGIAKKESAWGKRVPVLNQHDCFNYWGYRGKRRHMGTGGHTCFNSPKDAVDTVSRRLEKLVYQDKVDTPAEMMVVWKCGYDCSTHAKADTKKWIQDVNLYFHDIDEE